MKKKKDVDNASIVSLRMERQYLIQKANEEEYVKLYRDTQPGQNVYWSGFGQPPTLSFRANFDDIEFNRTRQLERKLVKGRFAGGTLGWIEPCDLELFIALYRRPLLNPTGLQTHILELLQREGPLTIRQMKEETGLQVKEITPVLHRLQEAFLIYEDQYDGKWDRGWYRFAEMFPEVRFDRYTRQEALKVILQRFAYRIVRFDVAMAKSFYRIPEKEIRLAVAELASEGILAASDWGYILKSDAELLECYHPQPLNSVYAIHRNDFMYRAYEHSLKTMVEELTSGMEYDHDPLQYLLIDGEFHGASVGHFRNGPYDLNDIVCDLPDAQGRKTEIIEAIRAANCGKKPKRFLGDAVF